MENIAVDCSWADAQLLQRSLFPPELRTLILESTGSQYLDTLAAAARLPQYTDSVFALYKTIFVDIVSRWTDADSNSSKDDVISLSSLARILPFAPHFRLHVREILTSESVKSRLFPSTAIDVPRLDDDNLQTLLLALFRLLSFDRGYFDTLLHPAFFSSLIHHDSPPVRYLAIECLCLVMHFADAFSETLVETYIGKDPILGRWEENDIDFRLLKLWEERRWTELGAGIKQSHNTRLAHLQQKSKTLHIADLSLRTAVIGGVLLPRSHALPTTGGQFVSTPTALKNLNGLGQKLLEQKPILLSGPAGSGKTSLILEAARSLNKLSSMVTLHLNEQTDAKSLIGLYISSTTGDSFEWQPGVLTKAMEQGRWVLIEDIDRAPSEVLGVLRPVLENGDLFLANRKERIRPRAGFRVLATVRSSTTSSKPIISRHAWLSNTRLWNAIQLENYSGDEISQLLFRRFPDIRAIQTNILNVHDTVCALYRGHSSFKVAQSRLPSLRDLMKWSRRVYKRVLTHNLKLGTGPIPESFTIDVFKDAIDCYASHLNNDDLHRHVVASVAQQMNISPQSMHHHLYIITEVIEEGSKTIQVGRTRLQKISSRRKQPQNHRFASTRVAQRTLESISTGVSFSEPYLLVGETGVGKTTLIQYVADLVGQKLTVVNLSQQSEATDLLGGLKPITIRSLVLPLVEQFNTLFDETFSARKNEKFQNALSKAMTRQNWPRLLILWQEALQLAEKSLKGADRTSSSIETTHPSKKRKLATSETESLRERWTSFSNSVIKVRSQVQRGDKGHAFAFVEGRLIQAVRNGEWLLLDEINLATSDTLDHIMGLLHDGDDEKPTILLTEAGNIEQVTAHKNFRIFAAMNPATDSGKKDLAPALRSRFTELYVQQGDKDVDDLIKIVQAYLGDVLSSDRRAALDLAKAYVGINKLNHEHRLSDGAGDAPHFSIRSLVRCLLYVSQHSASHGLRRAMYEGFAMSFFTVLSRESESLALPVVTDNVLSKIKNVKSFLSQQPKIPDNGRSHVAFKHHLVARGPLEPDLQPHYIRTPSVERNLLNLARAASMRRFPILLQGPTSAGKTSMVEYLAKLSGNKFVRINNHEHTDLQEYLGSYGSDADGKLQYKEGVLVDALRQGHWIVLDELNLAPSDVLEALNRLLDDNRELLIPESQEVVRPHPNFMLFATQNPAGLYGGRKRLSRAFRNRFLELHFDDIPEDELEIILRERAQIAPSYCTQIVAVYKKLSLQRQSTRLFEQRNSFATLRDLFRWASRPVDDRQQLANHGFMLLGERIRDPAERLMVKHTIEETMRVSIDESTLYGIAQLPVDIHVDDTIVWTSAMRRLFVLVSAALKNNEPVLLVGETGCGKTQICQVIAKAFGRPLNTYNAHTNTETGDLIGSQRPVRSRSELAQNVFDSLHLIFGKEIDGVPVSDFDVETLITRFNEMDRSSMNATTITRVKSAIGAYQSLFAWKDGSLVRSMRLGEHFLLDEISLADDSVLERLNSVLEPSRTILLAEKGSIDNLIVAKHDFQFLATMNPGGDYGKRELSAAMRNRLTEIWVPPLSQKEDILPILQAKLRDEDSQLAQTMLKFAVWFKATFSSSNSALVPLRDLLAWVKFSKTIPNLPPEMALVHGASLVYIDSLGANPAGMTATMSGDVGESRRRCLKFLQTLVSVDVVAIYNETPKFSIAGDYVHVGPFSMARVQNSSLSAPDFIFEAPTTLRNTMRVVRGFQMGRAILLEGSPGVGKTAIVTALAQAAGKPLTRVNLSDQTDIMDLFGTDAPSENERMGRFSWKDGPLLQAMQTGGWVLLDEMNLASQSVLEGLNSCLDHRREVYIAELDKSFTCHPEFFLFAAQNPHHQGGGRKGLPASFVNRFTVVYADPFQEEDLFFICRAKAPEVRESTLTSIIQGVFKADQLVNSSSIFAQGGPWEFNLRDVNRWLELQRDYPSLNPAYHFNTLVSQRFRNPVQKTRIKVTEFEEPRNLVQESYYPRLAPKTMQIGISLLQREAWKQYVDSNGRQIPVKQLPQAKSIITAVTQGWPVILAGSSGSGKTHLMRSLAAVSGVKLVEISMNADTDTMDLLGGFEQFDVLRNLVMLKQSISDAVTQIVQNSFLQNAPHNVLSSLLAVYQICQFPETTANDLRMALAGMPCRFQDLEKFIAESESLSANTPIERSRFVWNDGVLIDALNRGWWVVLDNANMCNASVLDRLNSLLEPDGHLVVSEHHNAEGGARIIRPHPSFRIFLTMDPRYGELSRAMRNRSLEIFLDPVEDFKHDRKVVSYPLSSRISQLREAFEAVQSGTEIEPFVDNLAFDDLKLLTSLPCTLSPQNEALRTLKAQLEIRQLVDVNVWQRIHALWKGLLTSNPEATNNSLQQPQLLLLAEPLFAAIDEGLTTQDARILLSAWQTAIGMAHLLAYLRTAIQNSEVSARDQMTAFEKSVILARTRKSFRDSAQPIYQFSSLMSEMILTFMSDALSEQTRVGMTEDLRPILFYIKDLVQVFDAKEVDPALVQAFLQIGRDLSTKLKTSNSLLGEHFRTALQLFRATAAQTSGQSLQRMWQTWKPRTPSSLAQLETKLMLEKLVDQFNSLAQTLPQPRSQLAAIKTRLLRASASAWEQKDSLEVVDTLAAALDGLHHRSSHRKPVTGHFEVVFDLIYRQIIALPSQGLSSYTENLPIFCGRNHTMVNAFAHESVLSDSLRKMATLKSHFDNTGHKMSLLLSKKLSNVLNQSLRGLDRVREELSHLAKILSSQSAVLGADLHSAIRSRTKTMFAGILICHTDLLTSEVRDCLSSGGSIDIDRLAGLEMKQILATGSEDSLYFRQVYDQYLQPAALILRELPTTGISYEHGHLAAQKTGAALLCVSLAALVLMVPDRNLDPALHLSLVRDRHIKRMTELQYKIEAQRNFHRQVMDQESSILVRLMERELAELGEPPIAPVVVRPKLSQLAAVQEEFSGVLRNILHIMPDETLLASNIDPARCATEVRRLNENIDRVVPRLQSLNRAYDDIVQPIIQLLGCLGLGAELASSCNETQAVQGLAADLARHVPLLGALPADVCYWPAVTVTNENNSSLLWLCFEASKRKEALSVSKYDKNASLFSYLDVIDTFYFEWKKQLSKDQDEAETKSRYYAYRGNTDGGDEAEQKEIDEMFPKFDQESSTKHEMTKSYYEGRENAIRLALLHEELFVQQNSDKGLLKDVLEAMRVISMHSSSTSEFVSFDELLPGLLLEMEEKIQSLNGERPPIAYNIYSDPNIIEAQKIIKLVQGIQDRFYEIGDRWPEHAVPGEVISFCDELLELKLSDPLAKLLTKAEKLLEIIAQWQSVASKEWSAATLMDELTALIISWRRLELSSWSRLLDLEKRKHEDNARSWYFIAYEAVLINSRQVVDEKRDVLSYCQELARTLEEFLQSATLGQFSPRLKLLETMGMSLTEAAEYDCRLRSISSCVSNVLFHYRGYEGNIDNNIQSGRAELEKAVVEQIKLASWKDTNVTALRDSARRSHHKLFKIVRKFRSLLEKPVGILKSNAALDANNSVEGEPTLAAAHVSIERIHLAITSCSRAIQDWNSRPERLRNPIGATASLRHVYSRYDNGFVVSSELASLRNDLKSSITTLRSETPSALTEDNMSLVRHLRERKRRLLADTVKVVAHMGIRRNLATSELIQQSSLATVLASSPNLPASGAAELTTANAAFHGLLDAMPQIRNTLTDHSPDLTEGETRRCVGLLEGFLSVTIKQRADLASSLANTEKLRLQISKIRSLCDSVKIFTLQEGQNQPRESLQQQMLWLPDILDLACTVLNIQNQRGEVATYELVWEIQSCTQQLRDIKNQIRALHDLPAGLVSEQAVVVNDKARQLILELGGTLKRWQTKEPNVDFILKQLIPWTEHIKKSEDFSVNGIVKISLQDADVAARTAADSVFVALQQLSAVKDSMISAEDSGWLINTNKVFCDSVRALHISEIAEEIQLALGKLQHLRPDKIEPAVSAMVVISPILEQFYLVCDQLQRKQVAAHLETCRLALFLCKSFAALAAEGFCSPTEKTDGQEQSGKLESGTGLGEGEGAEDISKDVGDDEDLSELAQSGDAEKPEGEVEKTDDAVDMGVDDLQGEMGDFDELQSSDENGDDQSGDEGEEMDEETGSVDDFDPTAVDEKMWDDVNNESSKDKELKNDKAKGESTDDQTAANEGKMMDEGDMSDKAEEEQNADEESDEDEAGAGKAEAENTDPHLQEEKALDLPDELQLTGEEEMKEDDSSDVGMDDLSDVEKHESDNAVPEEEDDTAECGREDDKPLQEEGEEVGEDEGELDGTAQDDEVMEDQPVDGEEEKDGFHTRDDDMQQDLDDNCGGETGAANKLQEDVDPGQQAEGQNNPEDTAAERKPHGEQAIPDNQDQGDASNGTVESGIGRDNNVERQQNEALRKLADVLDQWHQRREILNPSEDQQQGDVNKDTNMADADFEHLENEDEGDAQALGSAPTEQAQNLDQSRAIQDEEMPVDDDTMLPDVQEQAEQDENIAERLTRLQAQAKSERRNDGSFVPNQGQRQDRIEHDLDEDADSMADDVASDVQQLDLGEQHPLSPLTSTANAAQLWNHCSNVTQQFSLLLTEQLRLILSPTTATKLRGDFRTGKRLNLKRIIPYIASGYKRDKIWMRRSVPSKRSYQIMIAVDDSKSMSESGADMLAFETLAMLCKSLSMLEVGDICVVGFGDEEHIRVAHAFGQPFSNDSGVEVFKNFGFRQKGTDVKKLVQESTSIFQDARLKATGSAADLWQLQLIVSDGHCSDHDAVRRLVRKAQEDKIMIVFVIVDAAAGMGAGESILDLKEAVFEPDPDRDGEMRVRTKRYLEGFPFPYYLVVRDVRDLPGVLATALKGWFASVVDVM